MNKKVKKVVLVVGAGDATGAAIAHRFARENFKICVARRNYEQLIPLVESIKKLGGDAIAYRLDARKEDEVKKLFNYLEDHEGEINVVVFNVGGNVKFPVLETTSKKYFKVWEMCAFAGFLVGKEAARVMLQRKEGSIFFTGATASLRGASGFCAFSGGKAALRALAQSMARELGPIGVHVAHIIIDGVINTKFSQENFSEFIKSVGPKGILDPNNIADVYWWLYKQPKDSWTFELDLRPSVEKW
tara:strand:- start:169 stop:903 length:735 start_codon:yes stop_codon:yes gene_type:complete